MTDNSGTPTWRLPVLEAWHGVLAAGLSVLTAAAVVLVAHSPDPASADTYLTSVRNSVIRLADGRESTAEVGTRLPAGAQLRTGQGGGAQLFTAGRSVYVGALSTLDVLDGVRQKLERGQVMVDSRKGAALELATLGGTVATRAGALTRVETAAVLRVGVFEGSTSVTATGRRASTAVGALHQVQVPYGYLPGQITPLALTDDAWESRLASSLVSADQDLTHLADSLGGTDGLTLLTSFRTAVPAAGAARGEEALTHALAQATGRDALDEVRSDRSEGGSWGVVAALVGARVSAVSALLDAALAPDATPTYAAAPPIDLPGLLNPTPGPPTAPTVTPSTPKPRSTPPVKVTPTPTVSPTSGPVEGVLTTVLGLLPTPSSTQPLASPSPLLGLDLGLGH